MLDPDLSTLLWTGFVFFACACVGFVAGVWFGDHHQKQFCARVAKTLTSALAEVHATLEQARERERQHNAAGGRPSGFAYATPTGPGPTGAPAARAHERLATAHDPATATPPG